MNQSRVLREPEHGLWQPDHGSPRTRARFSENQSAPKLENRKTSSCSPRAPNLLHVLPPRMIGWNELCSLGSSLVICLLRRKFTFWVLDVGDGGWGCLDTVHRFFVKSGYGVDFLIYKVNYVCLFNMEQHISTYLGNFLIQITCFYKKVPYTFFSRNLFKSLKWRFWHIWETF